MDMMHWFLVDCTQEGRWDGEKRSFPSAGAPPAPAPPVTQEGAATGTASQQQHLVDDEESTTHSS
jgi:hypothetical protein